jgi:hypothetical protein
MDSAPTASTTWALPRAIWLAACRIVSKPVPQMRVASMAGAVAGTPEYRPM